MHSIYLKDWFWFWPSWFILFENIIRCAWCMSQRLITFFAEPQLVAVEISINFCSFLATNEEHCALGALPCLDQAVWNGNQKWSSLHLVCWSRGCIYLTKLHWRGGATMTRKLYSVRKYATCQLPKPGKYCIQMLVRAASPLWIFNLGLAIIIGKLNI